ncbi:DUF4406 domain-containing protein [Flavobacterium geliluteum]|uniref:DUF4406 domain-containing protein n=1 Tax=Flavobacterium geliluteum TaxID=2816120 RepID=A0A940XCV0_9FLAO|nr:DUF4406 domain-containing protein [Flavobacterium geliluteum]MBP4137435.1 DUF4406 domain-containing protein [Flavobacterium geliluteum]
MKKIYIAGKVTGLPENETNTKFQQAEITVSLAGFEAVNPIKVVNNQNADWDTAMRLCIVELMKCDAVFIASVFCVL